MHPSHARFAHLAGSRRTLTTALAWLLAMASVVAVAVLAGQQHARAATLPSGPRITLNHHRVTDPGTLVVTLRMPVTVSNPEVDAEPVWGTPDSPGPAAWAIHNGTVRAGQPVTLRLHFTPRGPDATPPGRWHIYAIYTDMRPYSVDVRFRVVRAHS
jgi:hypothetical protein